MRTTLTIDDDVLDAAKERARLEGRTAGEVISDLARQSLTRANARASTVRSGFPQLASRGVVVTTSLVDRLRDEDE
ncbi:MAG: CopG family transcriptional regulator [Tetrasphaera sp.]